MYFSQLPAVKKDTIFGAAQIKLGPSYFLRALAFCQHRNKRTLHFLFYHIFGRFLFFKKGFLHSIIFCKFIILAKNFKSTITTDCNVRGKIQLQLGKVISVTSNIIIFMASFQTLSQALCHKAPALAVLIISEPEFAKLELTELKFEDPEFDDWNVFHDKVSFIFFLSFIATLITFPSQSYIFTICSYC